MRRPDQEVERSYQYSEPREKTTACRGRGRRGLSSPFHLGGRGGWEGGREDEEAKESEDQQEQEKNEADNEEQHAERGQLAMDLMAKC